MATSKKKASKVTVTIKVSGNPKMEESSKFSTIYEIKAAKNLTNYTAAVNGEPVDDSYELIDGDWISFSPEVKGGASTPVQTIAARQTARYFKANPFKADKAKKNTGKAAEIAKILEETDFGCRREGVRKLMEIATGQKIVARVPLATFTPPPAVAVTVVSKNGPEASGHNQTEGTVLVSLGRGSFATPNGSTCSVYPHEVRPAKTSEIRKINSHQVKRFNDTVIYV